MLNGWERPRPVLEFINRWPYPGLKLLKELLEIIGRLPGTVHPRGEISAINPPGVGSKFSSGKPASVVSMMDVYIGGPIIK